MNINKPIALFLTAALGFASGAAMAADAGAQSNNGQANSAADAGQVAPGARENIAPGKVDNGKINPGDKMRHPDDPAMKHDNMSGDEVHKNTMCKDGRCPDPNKKMKSSTSLEDNN